MKERRLLIYSIVAALVFGVTGGFFAGVYSRDEFVIITTRGYPIKMNKRTGETWQIRGTSLERVKGP